MVRRQGRRRGKAEPAARRGVRACHCRRRAGWLPLPLARHPHTRAAPQRRRPRRLGTALNMLDGRSRRRLPAWERARAPPAAQAYYALPPDATVK